MSNPNSKELSSRDAQAMHRDAQRNKFAALRADTRIHVFDGSTLVATVADKDELVRRRLEWFKLQHPFIMAASGDEISLRSL